MGHQYSSPFFFDLILEYKKSLVNLKINSLKGFKMLLMGLSLPLTKKKGPFLKRKI
jgi:hypothetical protein